MQDTAAAVRQIGAQVGLDESQTATALSALVLSAGLQQNLLDRKVAVRPDRFS
jgi:hypothetical protein